MKSEVGLQQKVGLGNTVRRARIMTATKPLKFIFPLAAVVFICGCPGPRAHYLPHPEPMAVRGPYSHPGSKIRMPESVGAFRRDQMLRYDSDALDVSAGYNLVSPSHRIVATVYVCPSPSHVFIGASPETVAGVRAELTERAFERREQEIQRGHAGATLIDLRDTVQIDGDRSYPGKLAIFEYEDVFGGARTALQSRLYMFCFVGRKWTVEYRFTYPKTENADKEIQEFMQKWSWYGEGV